MNTTNTFNTAKTSYSELVTVMRQQLALSQEDLARLLGVSHSTVLRWENEHCIPSKLARVQLKAFRAKMVAGGQLVLPEGQRP